MGPLAELFYRRLQSVADDFGRYYAKPELLRSYCFPTNPPWVSMELVKQWLSECEAAGLIVIYRSDGADFLEILKFRQRKSTASKFPEPPGGDGSSQRSGKVYFMRSIKSGNIKIGFTEWSPEIRRVAVQSDVGHEVELVGWFAGARFDEATLHKQFVSSAIGNEWFAPSKELRQTIARLIGEREDRLV